jgi:hypothetical protein
MVHRPRKAKEPRNRIERIKARDAYILAQPEKHRAGLIADDFMRACRNLRAKKEYPQIACSAHGTFIFQQRNNLERAVALANRLQLSAKVARALIGRNCTI